MLFEFKNAMKKKILLMKIKILIIDKQIIYK